MLQAITISPELHHWLHPDSDLNTHDCAVTLLTKGLIKAAVSHGDLEPPAMGQWFCQHPIDVVFSANEYRFLPERAPPAISTLPS